MLQPITLSFLLSIVPALFFKRVQSDSLLVLGCGPNEALLQIEIKPDDSFPHDILSMVLSDLSSGMQNAIVAERSIAVNDTATIMSKDTCLPANHCLILAIYDSAGNGMCCGYHDEGWYYKITYDGSVIKKGEEFQSSEYLQFGGGCQTPPKDSSANDRHSLFSDGASAGDISAENSYYIALDDKGRRYFPRSPDRSEWHQLVPALPDCTKQGRIGCIVNPSSSRGASYLHLPSISYKQNPACANGICTLGIPMSNQHVDFTELLLLNVQHIGFTEAKTKFLPNSSGYNSSDIAAGDLNGDGLVNLVVATDSGTNNKIWLNSGDKAIPFKVAIDLPGTDSDSSAVVKLADIDNDSLLDIVFISGDKAFVLFNNITEPLNFRRVNLDTNTAAYDLSVGDANNDGWLDIIVGTESGIVLFLNIENDDNFDKIELPQLGGAAQQVAFVDSDNDGWIDIISLSFNVDVRVFMNKYGNGTFLEEGVIVMKGEYQRFCVGDVDGDGFPDLMLAKYGGDIELLVNNGTGFGERNAEMLTPPQANLYITSIEAGDLNGDGMIDLAFRTYGDRASSNFMILNKGGGEFTEAIDLPGGSSYTSGFVIADVNNDSALDIIIANQDGEDEVLLNLLPVDSSSFGAALSLPGADRETFSMLALGDLNQDGFIDIVEGGNADDGQANQILLNNGEGSFLKKDAIDLPTGRTSNLTTTAVAVGKIVGDDLPDIVVCSYDDGCEILINTGNLKFDPISLSSSNSYAIGIGDVNNDTFMDVIIGGYCDSCYGTECNGDALFINDNGNFTLDNSIKLPGFDATDGVTRSIALADFNGDSWLDIVIGCDGCANRLLVNDGNGQFTTSAELPGTGLNTSVVVVADFDLDGHVDIIFGGQNEPVIVIFNDGTGQFNNNKEDNIELPGGYRRVDSVALADMDGDGTDDIILGVREAENEVILNNGDRSFRNAVPLPGGGSLATLSIVAGDVNSDGWIDIIVGNYQQANQIIPFSSPCSSGGAQLHSRSWCFYCPSFMGLTSDVDSPFIKQCKECMPDHIQQSGLGVKCEESSCPLSERRLGQDQCSSCPDGTYYDDELLRIETDIFTWVSDRCVLCPTGMYANISDITAINKCFKCTPGTYQNETGASACKECEPGTFQTEFGAITCDACAVGGYCDAIDSCNGGFKPCPAGTFNNETGSNSTNACKLCPAGSFSIEVGANSTKSCQQCEPGTYQDEEGQTRCKSCKEGQFQNETNSVYCKQCKEGFYAANTGSVECIPCSYPLSSYYGSNLCSFCKEGFYLNDASIDTQTLVKKPLDFCLECPNAEEADCNSPNTTLVELPVKKGFWRDSPNTATLYPCNNKGVCVGYQPANRRLLVLQSGDEAPDIYCAANHTGPLCEVCIGTNDYFDRSNGICETCPSLKRIFLQAFIAVVIISSIGAFVSWLFMGLSAFSVFITSLNLQAKVKILVGFYQVISSFELVYGVSIDGKLTAWFDFFKVLSLDFLQIINVPRDCIGGGSKKVAFVFSACWPYILCVMLIASLFFSTVIHERLKETRSTDIKAVWTRFGMKSLYIIIEVFYFALPTVSMTIFDAKKCRAFVTNDATEETKSYLLFAMEMECDGDKDKNYSSLLEMFWVFFTLWPCLTPLLFLLLLTKVKKSVQQRKPTALATTCRFLWEDFDDASPIALYWDVIDTMRKIFLAGFINLLDSKEGSSKILRLSVACVVSTLYLTILLSVQPYKRGDDLGLATISSFLLVMCFGLGIILHLCEDGDESEGTCHTVVGLHLDSYKASIAVTVLAFGMLLITICALLLTAIRAPIVRLKSTGYSPNLEMPPDCNHHLFLSHVWRSGQDKTHVIARTLQLYLPKLLIWLDVDNLDDVGRLEECIAESAVVLIFYSEGYFRSVNCRRELYQAVLLDKPIIVVYEGDASVVGEMEEECARYCTDGCLIEAGNMQEILTKDPIQWLKGGSFSAETLKLVYMHLLGNLPLYKKIEKKQVLDKGLQMPNEVSSVALSSSIQLLICEENAGVRDLAIEIQSQSPGKITMKTLQGAESTQGGIGDNNPQSTLEAGFDDDDITMSEQISSDLAVQKQILLLYLNKDTFCDGKNDITEAVKVAKGKGIGIILVHEQDIDKGGCPFSYFFDHAPQWLIDRPYRIFENVAVPLHSRDEYRKVSLRLILQKMVALTRD